MLMNMVIVNICGIIDDMDDSIDIEDQLEVEHLFLTERRCRVCGEVKDLLDGFYRTRRGLTASSYSYECKVCTVERITKKRQERKKHQEKDVYWYYPGYYPDW